MLAGSRSRLSALARPWTVPEPLAETRSRSASPSRPTRRRAGRRRGAGRRWTGRCSWESSTSPPTASATAAASPDVEAALAHAETLLADGRDDRRHRRRIDPAGPHRGRCRSTEELRRVVPVIEALVRGYPDLVISHRHREGRRWRAPRSMPGRRSSTTCPRSGSIRPWRRRRRGARRRRHADALARVDVLEIASYRPRRLRRATWSAAVLAELARRWPARERGRHRSPTHRGRSRLRILQDRRSRICELLRSARRAPGARAGRSWSGPSRKRFLGAVTGRAGGGARPRHRRRLRARLGAGRPAVPGARRRGGAGGARGRAAVAGSRPSAARGGP